MNQVFKPLLRKCVLIFFDDILVYSDSLDHHFYHLTLVFDLMRQHQMFVKESKCAFVQSKVEYLGHFISACGVETDPRKIAAVARWLIPQNIKELRSFSGLIGYYKRFIPQYGTTCRPLHDLLKKGAYAWSEQAQIVFETLKKALVTATTLAEPDFSKQFVVETDASNCGVGAVLMQEGKPLAYISKTLGPKW